MSDAERKTVSDWQLDSLIRRRTLEATQEAQKTLLSTVKVVNQIASMPVGQGVQSDVVDALEALKTVRYMARLQTSACTDGFGGIE
jgi:hypothetical protein